MGKSVIRQKGVWLAVAAVWATLLWGCSHQLRTGGTVSVMSPDFFGIGENIARQLDMNHRQRLKGEQVIMTALVPLDSLNTTSDFGLVMSEALATQLFHRGVEVVETRKAKSVMVISAKGEFILSRQGEKIAKEQQASAIIAGTYSLTPQTVIVNVRLLGAVGNEVLSVAGIEIQRSPAINALLARRTESAAPELSAYELTQQGG